MAVRRITTLQGPTLKADDGTTAATIADSTGQISIGSGETNWTLPTARGADNYVLQVANATGAATWAESLTAPEIAGKSGMKINDYEAPFAYTGTTNETTTISSLSSDTGVKVGQYISGDGIPANTTIASITNSTTIVLSAAATASASDVALKIQKTPGEKAGGEVTLTGSNFGATIGEITVSITNSAGAVIANASTLSALSGGTSVKAEWNGTEGSYSTDLTSAYTGNVYFKMTKSGLSSNVFNSSTTLTADPTISTPTQSGGDVTTAPTSTSLGVYGGSSLPLDSNTELFFKFDRAGGTDIEDLSPEGGDGQAADILNSAPGIKASPFGDGKSAMYFDGTNDFLTIPDSDDWDIRGTATESYTIEMWYFPDSQSGTGNLIEQYEDASNRWGLFHSTSGLYFKAYGGGGTTDTSPSGYPPLLTDKSWNHIALVKTGASQPTYTIYINGRAGVIATTSSNTEYTDTLTGPINIGKYGGGGNFLKGYVDEIRIVKGVAVYTGDFAFPTSRLSVSQSAGAAGSNIAAVTAAQTKLLIHSNQSYAEDSNGLHPSNIGSFGSQWYPTTTTKKSWYSSSWRNDTGGGYLTSGKRIPAISGAFTIDGWVRIAPDQSGYGYIWDLRAADNTTQQYIFVDTKTSNSSCPLYFSTGSATGTSTATPDNWHHFAFVRNASGAFGVFKDGTQINAANYYASSGGIVPSSGTMFTIGAKYDLGSQLKGYFQDWRLSSEDLTLTGKALVKQSGTLGTNTCVIQQPSAKPVVDSNTVFLTRGDTMTFTDSATEGTTHAISTTGTYHSEEHKGIAPAIAWPNAGKTFGSCGVYFDGGTSPMMVTDTLNFGTSAFTIDFWFWCTTTDTNQYLYDWRQSGATSHHGYLHLSTNNDFSFMNSTQSSGNTITATNIAQQWNHMCYARTSAGVWNLYFNGTSIANGTGDSQAISHALTIGSRHTNAGPLNGYIDLFRVTSSDETASGGTLYNDGNAGIKVPTSIYGAYGVSKPNVGTITLTTSANDLLFADIGGTTLASKGLTLTDGGGSAATATITGDFNTTVSTDTLSTHLIRVRDESDHTRAIHFGGADGMTITQKSDGRPVLFNARRYKGNDSLRSITGYGFQPDLVWFKNRDDGSMYHRIFDSVRGGSKAIYSNHASAENTFSGTADGYVTSFDSDGVSITTDTSNNGMNQNDNAIIAWGWKAGGVPSAVNKRRTDDSSTETTLTAVNSTAAGADVYGHASADTDLTNVKQSVNSAGGFSITTYQDTGGGSPQNGQHICHGLNGPPAFVIWKNTAGGSSWCVWHKDLILDQSPPHGFATLDTDAAEVDGTTVIGTGHNNTSMFLGNNGRTSGNDWFVMYAWKAVVGVSAFGSHTSQITSVTGTTPGVGGYCGFKPRFVMIKNVTRANPWVIFDRFRSGADLMNDYLKANETTGDTDNHSSINITVTSTGFTTGNHEAVSDNSSDKYISIAFA